METPRKCERHYNTIIKLFFQKWLWIDLIHPLSQDKLLVLTKHVVQWEAGWAVCEYGMENLGPS